ncbi:XRE family transcriptional regulator [Brucella pseudogrignonensis]|nr:XRE family transcriptional regulator [Brucella pseudogrignonensis]PQZ39233.1 XRE family transcriptional regulator [Brucella pseudogrignonensis]PRA35873.1 XRE family transcriptional regulator [Brucella pseudogrignonensis]PRA62945.1 XRE family transcriptional regulator [Brucella pseudogrignonensis]
MNLPPNAVSNGGKGVIHMGLLNIIRRTALREKQSIREISRRTGLSRNTITKYLNAGTIEPTFTVTRKNTR